MRSIKRLCLIIAVALTMDAFIIAPAFSQQDDVAGLDKRIGELYRAGKFSEAIPLAKRVLKTREKARRDIAQ